MVTVAESTVRANIYSNLYTSLSSSLSIGTVTAAFIDDQPTFPQVVINPSTISIQKLTLNRGVKQYLCRVDITIYTKKNAQLDSIADEICADLNSNESTFKGYGMYLNDIEDGDAETLFWNNNKIHAKTLGINFQLNL